MRVFAQDLGGVCCRSGPGHPPQDLLEAAAGQCSGVEGPLEHFGGLRGVEPGCVVGVPAGDRTFDGARSEGLRSALSDQWVDAPTDGYPRPPRGVRGPG